MAPFHRYYQALRFQNEQGPTQRRQVPPQRAPGNGPPKHWREIGAKAKPLYQGWKATSQRARLAAPAPIRSLGEGSVWNRDRPWHRWTRKPGPDRAASQAPTGPSPDRAAHQAPTGPRARARAKAKAKEGPRGQRRSASPGCLSKVGLAVAPDRDTTPWIRQLGKAPQAASGARQPLIQQAGSPNRGPETGEPAR